jgi:hypothetical protein
MMSAFIQGFAMTTINWRSLAAHGIALSAIVLLAGCGPSDEEKMAEAEAQARVALNARKAAAAAKAADPTATMARAVATSKADVPIDLKYDILAKPLVGEAVEIELALIPTATGDAMSVKIDASAGLILGGTLEANFDGAKAGQAARTTFTAKSDKEDVFYITVATTMHAAGVASTRTYAIPIFVTAPPPPAEEKAADAGKSAAKPAAK